MPLHGLCSLQGNMVPRSCALPAPSPPAAPQLRSALRGILGPLPSVSFVLSLDTMLSTVTFSPTSKRAVSSLQPHKQCLDLVHLLSMIRGKKTASPHLSVPPFPRRSPVDKRGSSPLHRAFNSPAAPSHHFLLLSNTRWGVTPTAEPAVSM